MNEQKDPKAPQPVKKPKHQGNPIDNPPGSSGETPDPDGSSTGKQGQQPNQLPGQ